MHVERSGSFVGVRIVCNERFELVGQSDHAVGAVVEVRLLQLGCNDGCALGSGGERS